MKAGINPGNLHVRLGAVLSLREAAIFKRDWELVAFLQDNIFDYCSVYMTPAQQAKYEAMPGFVYGDDRNDDKVLWDLRAKLRYVFACVKKHNVFSKAEVEEGNADALDDFPEAEEVAA